jgi:hypothetical protein
LGLDQDLLRYISADDAPILQLVWCSLGYQIGWRNPNVKLRVRPGLRFRPHNSWGKTPVGNSVYISDSKGSY